MLCAILVYGVIDYCLAADPVFYIIGHVGDFLFVYDVLYALIIYGVVDYCLAADPVFRIIGNTCDFLFIDYIPDIFTVIF